VDGRLTVTLSTGTVLETDAVLVAAGRTPNTEGLGLDEAGVQVALRLGSVSSECPRGDTPRPHTRARQ
jgi:pyruvate/2-oxoglutarate dehydrogenase complex dihydrolipoamide dehydrogenase (E3) component